MAQNYFYPPSGGGASANPSVGANGITAPTSSTEVAGINPSGNQQPLKTDSSGNLLVSLSSDPSELNVNLNQVGGAAFALGQQLAASSLPVVLTAAQVSTLTPLSTVTVTQTTAANLNATIVGTGTFAVQAAQSGTWNLNNISGTVSLPTGASTAALQSNVQSAPGTAASTAITIQGNASGIAIPVSGTLSVTGVSTAANQTNGSQKTQIVDGSGNVISSTSNALNVNAASLPLPTGAATSANQTSEITQLTAINSNTSHLPAALGQTTMSASLPVVIASNQSSIPTSSGGNVPNGFVRNVYSSTNVTTAAYVQLIASTVNVTNVIEIFDSSGQTLEIAFGASGSEVPQFIVYPGGNGRMTVAIPASTRISIKALSATASAGEIDVNLFT